MRIHFDTNLLIQEPRFDLLDDGEHEFFISALCYAEFSEGLFHHNSDVASRVALDLIDIKDTFGEGLPFGARESDIYREVCSTLVRSGWKIGRVRRMDMMIASVAISDGAALATRNTSDFVGLESILQVIEL